MKSHQTHLRRGASRIAFVIGASLALIVILGLVKWVRWNRLPEMTRDDFNAARANWDLHGPADYEISVEVSGMQPGVYEVTVENGIATAATFDGRALTRQRTFGTWAVPGMFDTLGRDLETHDQHGYLMLGAEFHPQYGIPMKYQRIELRTGAHDALQWTVTRFEPRK